MRTREDEDDREVLSLKQMFERNSRMHSLKSVENGRNFPVRENDVFVSTYPKSGTTWMQFLSHNVRLVIENEFLDEAKAVSYTHLTLPTSDLV